MIPDAGIAAAAEAMYLADYDNSVELPWSDTDVTFREQYYKIARAAIEAAMPFLCDTPLRGSVPHRG